MAADLWRTFWGGPPGELPGEMTLHVCGKLREPLEGGGLV